MPESIGVEENSILSLNHLSVKVYSLLAESIALTQKELQDALGASNRSIRYALEELKRKGLIREIVSVMDARRRKYSLLRERGDKNG